MLLFFEGYPAKTDRFLSENEQRGSCRQSKSMTGLKGRNAKSEYFIMNGNDMLLPDKVHIHSLNIAVCPFYITPSSKRHRPKT